MTKLIPIDDFFIHLSLIIVTELQKCSKCGNSTFAAQRFSTLNGKSESASEVYYSKVKA